MPSYRTSHWLTGTLLFVLATGSSFGRGDVFHSWTSEPEVKATLGRQEVLIPAGHHGLNYFADEPICILKKQPFKFLMVCGNDTYLLRGDDWKTAAPVGKVLSPGPKGSPDNGYAGIGAIFVDKRKKRLIAFYHAEDHEDIGKVPVNNVPGFFGTICIATAPLNGKNFTKLGPGISADKPKMVRGWETEGGPRGAWLAQGVGEPHVCVDGDGKYLLCYFTEWSNRLRRGVQICLARSAVTDRGLPGTWKKHHEGGFTENGLGGHDTPVIAAGKEADTYTPHVTWIKEWQRYVMVFGVGVNKEIHAGRMPPKESGLYLTTSQDGIHWKKPQRIVSFFAMILNNCRCAVHPTLLISSVNDDTARGQLLYGYTPKWPDTPHHLVGQPISIALKR